MKGFVLLVLLAFVLLFILRQNSNFKSCTSGKSSILADKDGKCKVGFVGVN